MRTHRSTRARRRQDGQVLVVVVGGMVLILAIVSLVIDLGFVFMLRRQEQNAADPGAVAAARYIPGADRAAMWTAACFYASQNGSRQGDPTTTRAAWRECPRTTRR